MLVRRVDFDFSIPCNLSQIALVIGMNEDLLRKSSHPDKAKFVINMSANAEPMLDEIRTIDCLKETLYFKHLIPKRNAKNQDGYRTVWQASSILADSYKSFARRFDLYLRSKITSVPHPAAFGYVRGKSTFDNAIGHCRAKQILHADIANFFPSISVNRIEALFLGLDIKKDLSSILAQFVTINGSLPLGLHPSPMLANAVCLELDNKLSDLAERLGCYYTRYADDITISGNSGVPDKNLIAAILEEEGFQLSQRKFRVTKQGQSHFVTGLSVADSRPHIPRRMKKQLRQELYYCKKYGVKEHLRRHDIACDGYIRKGVNRIDGTFRYVAHIEKGVFYDMQKEWHRLLGEEFLSPIYETRPDKKSRNFYIFVDETEISFRGKKFLALCFVQTEDHEQISVSTKKILDDNLVDPFYSGKKEGLKKNLMHFNDANETLREIYIKEMRFFHFNGYLAYADRLSFASFEACYLSLVENLISRRLMSCDNARLTIVFEENSTIDKKKIIETVSCINNALKSTRNRHPYALEILVGKKKDHICFALPDFLLAVFSKYARSNLPDNTLEGCKATTEREKLLFEMLRDKYRVILNRNDKLFYSRKRPFEPWK